MIHKELFEQSSDDGTDRNISDVLRLVESTTTSLGKDIDRYSFKVRDLDNAGFMITVVIFIIYAVISIIVLQVTIDHGINSIASLFGETVSKRMITGFILIISGFPIIFSLIARYRKLRSSIGLLSVHIEARINFAEQVLTRVTTWENRFKGDYYQRSILRLRIAVLAQLIEEMESISASRAMPFLNLISLKS